MKLLLAGFVQGVLLGLGGGCSRVVLRFASRSSLVQYLNLGCPVVPLFPFWQV